MSKMYSEHDFYAGTPPKQCTQIVEAEKQRVVIYDASGQPWSRPETRIGFDLSERKSK